MAAQEYTTISVDPALRDELRSLKRGQERYSDVLERLLQEHKNDSHDC
jgi:predicted CopG family antitoxin